MKTWIKRTLIGVFGATVLFGGLAAWAHRHHGGPMTAERIAEIKPRVVDRVASKLDLDAAQKARLGVVADRLAEQRTAMLAGGDPRTALNALVAGPAFDRAGAEALLTAKSDVLRAGAPSVIAAFGDFYDGLNPDQQAKLRELMNRRHRD
jgi:periplasmic protein CpxP/Spy